MMKYTTQKLKALGLIVLSALSSFSHAQTTPASNFKWSQAGPVYNAGRSRNLVVDQRDASGNTMYTGSASSGVFKTTNGGVLWSVVNNTTSVLNISYMAQAVDNRIFVATGEGFLRTGQKAKAQIGTGLYKLEDSGELTLIQSSSVTGTVINRIACSPLNANKMALATNLGILVSIDGGNNFTLATGVPANIGMDVKFNNAGILYCTVGGEAAGSPSSKIYKSQDDNFTGFNDITPLSSVLSFTAIYGRIELAIAPSNTNVVYASIANKFTDDKTTSNGAFLKGLFVSYDAGLNWALLHQGSAPLDPLTNGAAISSGDYAHTIGVNPGNPNQIWIAGYRFYICSISGSPSNPVGQWLQIGNDLAFGSPYYLHQNIHDIKPVGSGASAKFYFVTDAGIYRSVDLANGGVTGFASFQAFYKGLVTGQFNSVSIEAYPAVPGEFPKNNNEKVDPLNGFIGGTGGNGFTYFSGDYAVSTPTDFATVVQESNYLSGEVYNVEYSKILPGAAFLTVGKDRNGDIYRSSNVKTSAPVSLQVNSYKGALSQIVQSPTDFLNNANTNTGSIFRLWENYGQITPSPDSIVFYNDSIRVSTSIGDVPTLISQSTFSFQAGRPNKNALIDSIAIRTGTVIYEATSKYVNVAFTASDKKDVFIKLPNNYTTPTATTVPPIGSIMGPASSAKVILNATSALDEISVTFTAPPFANKTAPSQASVPSPAVFYRVYATVFYKYKKDDTVYVTDNSISTKPMTYTIILPGPRRWAASSNTGPKPVFPPYNQPVKVPARYSARLAVGFSGTGTDGVASAIIVSKSPLSLNDPLTYIRVSGDKALTMDANGNSTNSVISIPSKPSLIEWSKSGTELYYATEDNNLYRVSNIFTIMDYSPGNNYFGKLTTDIFKYNGAGSNPFSGTIPNPMSPYRTTLIGSFNKPITSIAIREDKYMALTFNDPSGDIVKHSDPNQDIRKCDYTNSGFATRNGSGLSNLTTYCSLIEKDDSKKMFVGTDKGVYYTNDVSVSAPIWTAINNGQLPAVQVFDIEQQVLEPWNCYNSGQIYVATYGRGVWTNKEFFKDYFVSINEQEKPKAENNLSIFPNPTDGRVFINFSSLSGENASLQVMDMNGRLVKSEPIGKLYAGQVSYSFETSDLSAGIYIVSVNSDSNVKRVAKLVVAK
jgi:hypothetical protein